MAVGLAELRHGQHVDVEQIRKDALAHDIRLEDVARLLEAKRGDRDRLVNQLQSSTNALNSILDETQRTVARLAQRTQDARGAYLQLEDELVDHRDDLESPLSARNNASSSYKRTLVETLQDYHKRLNDMDKAKHMFGHLAKAEGLSLIAKEQIKLPSPEDAFKTYCELVHFSHIMYALVPSTSTGLMIAPFVRDMAVDVSRHLGKVLEAKVIKTLDSLKWPASKLHGGDLDYANDARARDFKAAFVDLVKFEQTTHKHPLPQANELTRDDEQPCVMAVAAVAQPLILRFRYHFDSKRQTNRLDKPEWYFAHVLNSLSDHENWLRSDIQNLLREGGMGDVDAMTDFITALLRPLTKKVKVSVPQLLELPSLLAHTIYQALQFDSTIREAFAYAPRQVADAPKKKAEWKGISSVILGNLQWFDGWRHAEKKNIDDKYFEIIGTADAWHINEDYAPANSGVLRPTNSAIRVRDLFDQVTDRYRPLPSFKLRLPFLLDIQLPLLDEYIKRIGSATDAFETLSFGLIRAVPGSLGGGDGSNARLTNGLNGLQRLTRAYVSASWMVTVSKNWSEDVFFLDMWQDIRERSITDATLRMQCNILLERAASKADSTGIFDGVMDQFQALAERIEELIIKQVHREVVSELKSYLGRRWDTSFETSEADGISPDLISPVTVFSALLSALASALPPLILNRMYRRIAGQLQETLVQRGVLPKIWSEAGGRQFLFDVEHGWLAAAKEASAGKVRRPENGLRKLVDAAKLVSLPSSTSDHAAEHTTISKVIQVAWDDTNDAAFLETMDKIGVRELVGRKDVKAILRKRPECWR